MTIPMESHDQILKKRIYMLSSFFERQSIIESLEKSISKNKSRFLRYEDLISAIAQLMIHWGALGSHPAQKSPQYYPLISGVLTALLPPLGKIGLKLGFLALNFLGLLLVGSVFTTAVCTFTPLCTISFLGLGFNRESVRSIVTQDNLLQASRFVTDAIEKFKAMQKKPKTKSD
ncbi:hypothetical protein AAG570_010362 [Ranatra chinensis]|uniref:Uncharacterized protein n=1 Tax=Ranatra chinensis TaxID=642074 RepID=A0ABD0YMG3_9HEMI